MQENQWPNDERHALLKSIKEKEERLKDFEKVSDSVQNINTKF